MLTTSNLAINEDKPIMIDYWMGSINTNGCVFIGVKTEVYHKFYIYIITVVYYYSNNNLSLSFFIFFYLFFKCVFIFSLQCPFIFLIS